MTGPEHLYSVPNGIESRGFATKAVHAGSPHDPATGAVIPAVSNNFFPRIPGIVSFFYIYPMM